MGIKSYSPYTPSRRHMTGSDFSEITTATPEKSLVVSLNKNAGRNNQGKITVRHRGGGSRRKWRNNDREELTERMPGAPDNDIRSIERRILSKTRAGELPDQRSGVRRSQAGLRIYALKPRHGEPIDQSVCIRGVPVCIKRGEFGL